MSANGETLGRLRILLEAEQRNAKLHAARADRFRRTAEAERIERRRLEGELEQEKGKCAKLRADLRRTRSGKLSETEIFRAHGVKGLSS